MEDLQTDGLYSPISIKKFLVLEKEEGGFKILIDSSGLGILNDDKSLMTINSFECAAQAAYFRDTYFPDKVPSYLLEYMNMFFYGKKELPVGQELEAINGMIKYCDTNKEAGQCIGLILLIYNSLVLSKHYKVQPRLFIEHPETYLHPKRASAFMSVFYDILDVFKLNIIKD